MMGGDTPDGIIPRLNSQLFSEVKVRTPTAALLVFIPVGGSTESIVAAVEPVFGDKHCQNSP